MIRFLFKGIIRDRSRSLLPVIVVALGVFLTVFMSGFFKGVMTDIIDMNARFSSGHVKVVTRAYAENADQAPIDLAIIGVSELKNQLQSAYPDMDWVERIRTGGLLDVRNTWTGSSRRNSHRPALSGKRGGRKDGNTKFNCERKTTGKNW